MVGEEVSEIEQTKRTLPFFSRRSTWTIEELKDKEARMVQAKVLRAQISKLSQKREDFLEERDFFEAGRVKSEIIAVMEELEEVLPEMLTNDEVEELAHRAAHFAYMRSDDVGDDPASPPGSPKTAAGKDQPLQMGKHM